jgi:hypothetical protein
MYILPVTQAGGRTQALVMGSALEQERERLRTRLQRLAASEQQLQFVGQLLRDHARTHLPTPRVARAARLSLD